MIVNRRVHHGSDIVKLISCVMSPDDNKFGKPIGLKTFTTALEKIGLESDYVVNAPVKLFCTHPPPPGSPGVRRKMCVINKGRALENEVKVGRDTQKLRD